MALDQNIRFRNRNDSDLFNPEGLYDFVLPSRILVLSTDPLISDGEQFWYSINSITGAFWFKDNTGWIRLPFTFNTGGIPGITGIINEGGGAGQVFDQILGSTAFLRTFNSTTGKITISTTGQTINLGVNINKSDVGLAHVQDILSNLNSNTDPLPSNDNTQGYSIGSLWNNVSGAQSRFFVCKSNSIGAAIWTLVGPSAGGGALANIGTGQNIYVTGSSSPAQIRSLISSSNKVSILNTGNELNLGVTNLSKADVGLNNVVNILNNYTSTSNPTVTDASNLGYSIGSIWFNTSAPLVTMFVCRDATIGAAIWYQIGNTMGIFKDLASFGFSITSTTPISISNTFFPLQAPWIISPVNFTRPTSSGWAVTGNSPFFNITRLAPTTSLGGTNYYEVTYSFVVTAGGPPGSTELIMRWNRTGNCTVGNSNSTLVIPTTGTKGTLAGSFLVASFDPFAFSLFVEISSTAVVVPVSVQYAAFTITQI